MKSKKENMGYFKNRNRKNSLALWKFAGLILSLILIFSCNKKNDFGEINTEGSIYKAGEGIFILNEGILYTKGIS